MYVITDNTLTVILLPTSIMNTNPFYVFYRLSVIYSEYISKYISYIITLPFNHETWNLLLGNYTFPEYDDM